MGVQPIVEISVPIVTPKFKQSKFSGKKISNIFFEFGYVLLMYLDSLDAI